MSTETTPAAVETPAPATSELQTGAAAAPADGGAAPSQTQQTGDDPNAPQNGGEGQGQRPIPEHRTPQYRFSELTRQRNEAERIAAEERGRRLALEDMVRSGIAPRADHAPQPAVDTDPRPKPEDHGGEFSNDYLVAIAEWSGRQAAIKLSEKAKADAREAESRNAQQAEWDAAGARYKDTLNKAQAENYFEGERLLRGLVDAKSYDLVDDITDSTNPHALAQWLATPKQNPEHETYRRQVLNLPPRQRQRELARVDDMLTTHFASQRTQQAQRPAQSQAPNTSPAPTPSPTPTAPSGGGGAPIDPSRMNFKDFEAHFNRVRAQSEAARG